MSGEVLLNDINKDEMVKIDDLDSPYAFDNQLKELIYARGL